MKRVLKGVEPPTLVRFKTAAPGSTWEQMRNHPHCIIVGNRHIKTAAVGASPISMVSAPIVRLIFATTTH